MITTLCYGLACVNNSDHTRYVLETGVFFVFSGYLFTVHPSSPQNVNAVYFELQTDSHPEECRWNLENVGTTLVAV